MLINQNCNEKNCILEWIIFSYDLWFVRRIISLYNKILKLHIIKIMKVWIDINLLKF